MSDLTFGLWLTVVGMGVVFGLLALLWAMLAIVGRLDRRQSDADGEEGAAEVPAATTLPLEAPLLTDEELAAITIAVASHRIARRRQAAPETRSAVPGSQLWASRWLAAGRTRQTRGWQGRR